MAFKTNCKIITKIGSYAVDTSPKYYLYLNVLSGHGTSVIHSQFNHASMATGDG
jgi:hypothetical protein